MLTILALASTLLLLEPPAATPPADRSKSAATAEDKIPASLFLKEKPKDAKDVREAKKSAKVDEKIVLTGRIGGRKEPFTAKRAVFTFVDPSVKACSEEPDDKCTTPWDFCCESKESLMASMATVQIVGPDGKPLKVTAEGAGGMKPLSKVTVVGKVKSLGKEGELVVLATGIFVE